MKLSIDTTHVPQEFLNTVTAQLEPYLAELALAATASDFTKPENSLALPADKARYQAVCELVSSKQTPELSEIVLIGIGGSSLGTKAIYEAVRGARETQRPRLVFLETIDSELIRALGERWRQAKFGPESIALVLVSKSGATTESLANFELLMAEVKTLGDLLSRILIITDHDSALAEAGKAKGLTVIEIPPVVGGRFSVFSAVGLVPLELAGISTAPLLHAARAANATLVLPDPVKNPALARAAVLWYWYTEGRTINESFIFEPRLEALGKWYRQLVGESLGKNHGGFTPLISIGTQDLHSIAQLNLAGPEDKITTLVWAPESTELRIPSERIFPTLVPMIAGQTTAHIREAIFSGVQTAYQKRNLPFMTLDLSGDRLAELGEYLETMMVETMLLGKLLRSNPFDQPAVEEYKTETKRLLSS